ncbi:hypothetical protein CRG98_008242 [Punica granatum]|uniref:Uncharacterized protein n=1 Tax=Punica granatum TaxID=22663 RepID=A0A2I0KSV0_PUNGR|nr:hypothetical protein CRG98_008242 [Punica granatum]
MGAMTKFAEGTYNYMAILPGIFNGLRLFITTLWDLQELRFSNIFDDVSSVVVTIIVAAVSCFLAARGL